MSTKTISQVKQEKKLIKVPFEGFYCSIIDSYIDNIEEEEKDHRCSEDINPYDDIKIDKEKVCKAYIDCLNEYLEEHFGIVLDLEFHSLKSPRFYNFETDSLYCEITNENLIKLKRLAFKDKEELQKNINDNYKTRDGFFSFYNEFCSDWEDKKLSEWDVNELYALFPEIESFIDVYEQYNCNFSEELRNNCITFIES